MNKYQDILSVVEEEIGLVLEKIAEGIELQEPINSKLFTFLNSPSKHIRPLVSFLYLKAIGVKIDKSQILCQTAVEIISFLWL
jgi:geranylgeranyl pyrophosphate synthase